MAFLLCVLIAIVHNYGYSILLSEPMGVQLFVRTSVVLQRGIPFEVKLPENRPIALGTLPQEEFDAEIEKGMADIESGSVYSAEEVEAEMKRDFGI